MKKYLLLNLFLLVALIAKAQISFSPNPYILEGEPGQYELTTDLVISQSYADTATLYWKFIKSDNFPSEWDSQICDCKSCYTYNKDSSTEPNYLLKDSTCHWSVHIIPNNVSGSDTMYMEVYDDVDFTNLLVSIPVYVYCSVVGTDDDFINNDIEIYPNPSADYFRILEDENIEKIAIYNIIGKKMVAQSHYPGQSHYINNLQNGLYLVRMLDKDDNIVKVVRMTKK